MAEKILNTRVLLKTDTLENWSASTLPLKKGEIAIATVAAGAGTGLTEPVVMIKVGEDGVKTFKDLPWNFYAKASDVIAAAKSESELTTFINNVIAKAGIATDEALTTLAGRVDTAEGKITTAEGKISTLESLVGSDSVADQINTAIANLNLSNTYAAKVHTHTKADITDFDHTHAMADITGLDDAIAGTKTYVDNKLGNVGEDKGTVTARINAIEEELAAAVTFGPITEAEISTLF